MLVSGGRAIRELTDWLLVAVIDDDEQMDSADIANALKQLGGVDELERGELTALSRMHELRVKKAWQEPSGIPGV